MGPMGPMGPIHLFVDGDGCPVKEEVYRVARRYGLKVYLVSNAMMRAPYAFIEVVAAKGGQDAADDWIADHIGPGDITITADIELASRCLKKGARAIGPKGQAFTEDSIGSALATRALMDQLRQTGVVTGGPAPFSKQDRSRFLARLDDAVQAIRRGQSRS